MANNNDKIITLSGDDGDIDVEVIEQTIIDGVTYLLVADVPESDDDECDCYVLKDVSEAEAEEANYEVVPYEEAGEIFDKFNEMLKDDV